MNTKSEEPGAGSAKGDGVADANVRDDETPSPCEERERARREGGAAPAAGEKPPVDARAAVPESNQPLLFLIQVASVVELIATGDFYEWKIMEGSAYSKYTASVSAIPMILSFLEMWMLPWLMPYAKFLEDFHAKAMKHMHAIMFVWIFVGTCFMTFREPFVEASNGYFAAWASAYGGAMVMGLELPTPDSTKVKAPASMMGLTASAIAVLVAAIEPMRAGCPPEGEPAGPTQCYQGEATFAFALAGFTIGLVMGRQKLDMDEMGMGSGRTDAESAEATMLHAKLELLATAVLAAAWTAEAGVMTFRGPFDKTGNGYFGSWAGAATSTFVAFANLQAMRAMQAKQAMRGGGKCNQEGKMEPV